MEVCERHHKEVQAFCEDEGQLLCIDCLIDQARHKSHRVENLETTHRRFKRLLEQHEGSLKRVEVSFGAATQKAREFRTNFESFRVRIANRLRFTHLSALKVVSEGFSELVGRTTRRLEQTLAAASKIFARNEEDLEAVRAFRAELAGLLAHEQGSRVPLIQYYLTQLPRFDVERLTKRTAPNVEPWSSKETFNEFLFLNGELQKTLDKIRFELGARPQLDTARVFSAKSISKRDLPPPSPADTSRNSFDDLAAVTQEQLMTIAQGFKDNLKKTNLSFVVTSSDLKLGLQDTVPRISPDLSETHRRQTSPLSSFVKLKPPSESSKNFQSMRNQISFRDIRSGSFNSTPMAGPVKSIRELLNPMIPERVVIVGGKKSKNCSIKFFDFGSGQLINRKVVFPPIKKQGTAYFEKALYFIGGKIGGKASDRILRYNPRTLGLEEQIGFTLSRKKYDFGFVMLSESVGLLFGGKNEKGIPVVEIERLDFKARTAKIVGKLGQPKSGLIAIKVNTTLVAQPAPPPSSGRQTFPFTRPVSDLSSPFDPLDNGLDESKTISFNISEIDQRIVSVSNLNYSFEQNRPPGGAFGIRHEQVEDDLISAEDQRLEITDGSFELESEIMETKDLLHESEAVLLIGGQNVHKKILSTIEIYYPSKRTTHFFSDLTEPRKAFCALLGQEKLFVFGGRSATGLLKSIEQIQKKICKVVGNMTQEKEGFKGVFYRDEFLLIGGEGSKGTLDIIEHLVVDDKGVRCVRRDTGAPSLSFYDMLRIDFTESLM